MKQKQYPIDSRVWQRLLLGLLGTVLVWGALSATHAPDARSEEPEPYRGDPEVPELLTWERLDSLPEGGVPPLGHGDPVAVRSFWNRDGLTVAADLSVLDPSAPDSFPLVAEGDGAFLLQYTLADSVTRSDGAEIPIPLIATAADTSVRVQNAITVCLSEFPPTLSSVMVLPERTAYRGGDVIRIQSTWSSPIGMSRMLADLSAVEPDLGDSLLAAGEQTGATFTLTYTIPIFEGDRGPDDTPLFIPLLGEDNGCGVARADSALSIVLDQDQPFDPVLLDWRFENDETVDGEPVFRNGDTVRLWTRWDRENLELFADFFEIAPEDTARAFVKELGGGEYRIFYMIPEDNPQADGSGRTILLVAEGPRGERTVEASVTACLSNSPPEFLSSRLDPLRDIYTRGDTVRVVSRWSSPQGFRNLRVSADIRAIEPAASETSAVATLAADSFVVEYRIPFDRDILGEDGDDIVIPVQARDAGCGVTVDRSISVATDTSPPENVPVLDPLPAQTSADSIVVQGSAPGAFTVGVLSFSTFRAFVSPDSTGRFAAKIALQLDRENSITALAEDEHGNRTLQSDPVRVNQVSESAFEIPAPFLRGEEFILRDPRGVEDVVVRMFDLEGAALREWTSTQSGLELIFVWDGNDSRGERMQQGYYLLRAEWNDASGTRRELTDGLILGN